jgi:hypothetical protein
MLTFEELRGDIVDHQFPIFSQGMLAKGICTSCKADFAVNAKGSNVGRVTVQAREVGVPTDVFVLSFLDGGHGQVSIHMTRFSGQAGGGLRRTELLQPFSDTPSRDAVANAFTLFEGATFKCLQAKVARLKKNRRQPSGIRARPGDFNPSGPKI